MESFAPLLSDRLLMLAAALVLSALWFSRLRPQAPARRLEAMLGGLARKLNRAHRSVGTRVYRGLILLLLSAGCAAGIGYGIHYAANQWPWLALLELAVMAYLLPVRALRDQAAAVGHAVKRKQLAQAKGLAQGLARTEVKALDASGLLRVSLEYVAENFNDKLVAPALWYLALGLPALCALRVINLLDGLVGHKSAEFLAFGWAAAKLDDALMFIPARVAALLVCVAALFIPKGKPFAALKVALREARKMASPNAGWPIAAMAGALGVSLGGARKQAGALTMDAWIGQGSAKIADADFRRGLALYAVGVLLLLLACAGALKLVHSAV
jgi:adenosylcobinamide-phosphate synthase